MLLLTRPGDSRNEIKNKRALISALKVGSWIMMDEGEAMAEKVVLLEVVVMSVNHD